MNKSVTETIINFVRSIGIEVILRPIDEPGFLPGLLMENGKLIIDPEKLLYPGDILHEAGHLATMVPEVRATMSDNLENNDLHRGGEIMALGWSYAACIHLKLHPSVVFHADGYRGTSETLISTFADGTAIGLPLLQWAGLTYNEERAKENNTLPYPNMIRWTREN